MFLKTVKEAALEQEVASLRRDNARLQYQLATFSPMMAQPFGTIPDTVVNIEIPAPIELRLMAGWQVDKDDCGRITVFGHARTKDGRKYEHTYYISPGEIWPGGRETLNILGKLHGRVIDSLAADYVRIKD